VSLRAVDLEVDRVGRLSEVDAYVSRHGPLVVDGAPVLLGSRPQAELRAALAA
jgi:hypothetical protein